MSRRCAYRFVFALAVVAVIAVGCPTPPPTYLGPTAAFAVNITQGYVPLTVQFSDQSQPGQASIYQWRWDFGDGTVSTERNPSHTYFLPGAYTVSLTVTSGVGSGVLTREELIQVREPAAVEGIGSSGGTISAQGASLVVPAGILEDMVVFILAPNEGDVPVVGAENEELVSDVYTLAQDYGTFISGPATPMILTLPFSSLTVPFFHRNATHLQIMASLPDGMTIPIPADIDDNFLVASIAGLPAQAAYAVVYRPLADSVTVSPSKLVWSSGEWRINYSPLGLQELTALRIGSMVDVLSYDRKNWSFTQTQTTLNGVRNSLSDIHETAHDAGFISPALITNEDDEYSLVFYHLAPTPLPPYDTVGELIYTTSIFGSIIIDPVQLIEISKRNALGTPDQAQEMDLPNAMAQELYRSIVRGYDYFPYTTNVDGNPVVFSQGLEDSVVTFLGQVSDDSGVRSFGENEYARLDETLFAPYSLDTALYSYSGQDFLAYAMRCCAPSDPCIFLGDAYQGVLSLLNINLTDPSVNTFGEAMVAMRAAFNTAMDLSFDRSLASVYWTYAKDRAYENSEMSKLRPSDDDKDPFSLNPDVFGPDSVVDVNITTVDQDIEISDEQYDALGDVPPMTTRVLAIDAVGISGELVLSADWNNWLPDVLGNSVNIKVYRDGSDGTELTENAPSVALDGFGAASGEGAFARAIVIISNVSLDTTYDLEITAEVNEGVVTTVGSIAGRAVVFGTLTPIANVSVQVRREGSPTVIASTTTNAMGDFQIGNLQAGNIVITFSKMGYNTLTVNRTVVADQSTSIQANMVPS